MCCGVPTQSTKRRVLREHDRAYSVLRELLPVNVKPTKFLCKPCFRDVEKITTNGAKIEQLISSTDAMKADLAGKLKELYTPSSGAAVSPTPKKMPSPGSTHSKKLRSACRSLNFNKSPLKESPGVVVSIVAVK